MNRKKWICTAAAITGLLLAVIAGLSIRHMKNSSYVSASELAGQKVEIAALDRTRMKKLPKMIAVQVSQKMTARRVRLSLKQSQRISW